MRRRKSRAASQHSSQAPRCFRASAATDGPPHVGDRSQCSLMRWLTSTRLSRTSPLVVTRSDASIRSTATVLGGNASVGQFRRKSRATVITQLISTGGFIPLGRRHPPRLRRSIPAISRLLTRSLVIRSSGATRGCSSRTTRSPRTEWAMATRSRGRAESASDFCSYRLSPVSERTGTYGQAFQSAPELAAAEAWLEAGQGMDARPVVARATAGLATLGRRPVAEAASGGVTFGLLGNGSGSPTTVQPAAAAIPTPQATSSTSPQVSECVSAVNAFVQEDLQAYGEGYSGGESLTPLMTD